MADLRSSGYAAGASKMRAQHKNWAQALGDVAGAGFNIYQDVDDVLNTIRAQEDEKITRYLNTTFIGIQGEEGADSVGLLSKTYDQNKDNPDGLVDAYMSAYDSVVNVESIMKGANVSQKAAERWINEYSQQMKSDIEAIALSNTERAGKEKALSTESARQDLIAESAPDWENVESQISSGYEATGIGRIDGGRLSIDNPENRISLSNSFASHRALQNIETNIGSGLTREQAIDSAVAEFRSHAPVSGDPIVLQQIEDTASKLEESIGSYYDQQYDEASRASSRKFDTIVTEALAYMDSHNGSLTRDAINEIALNRGYNPEDSFDYSNMMGTLRSFGFLGGAEETFMMEPVESEVPKSPEERFLSAAKNYIATNGDIDATALEELASTNEVDLTTESGQEAYQQGLVMLSSAETAREAKQAQNAMDYLLSNPTVDWESDTGIGTYNYSIAEGQIDEDLTLLSASNQAALQNFNNLNTVNQGGAQPYSYVTTLKPLADRVMQEYGITSPEAQNNFMSMFTEWERNIVGTKPPTAVEADINEKFYDISMDDASFSSYLLGKIKSKEITPSYAIEILQRGDRQTLLQQVTPIKNAINAKIDSMGLETEDASALKYQMLQRYGAGGDLSSFYLNFGDRSPAEIDKAIGDTVTATWNLMNSNEFLRGLNKGYRDAFATFLNDDSWDVSDYDLGNMNGLEVYTQYLNGNLGFTVDGSSLGRIETAILNEEMSNYNQLQDNASQIVYDKDYSDLNSTEKNLLDGSISIAMTEASMTRIYQNYFGENSPQKLGNWKTCRVDGQGIGYMNDGGVLVVMPYQNLQSGFPVFSIYKFNQSDEEYQSVWGRNANNNYVISVAEYMPSLYDVSELDKRTKHDGGIKNSVYQDPAYLSAVRIAVNNRNGR